LRDDLSPPKERGPSNFPLPLPPKSTSEIRFKPAGPGKSRREMGAITPGPPGRHPTWPHVRRGRAGGSSRTRRAPEQVCRALSPAAVTGAARTHLARVRVRLRPGGHHRARRPPPRPGADAGHVQGMTSSPAAVAISTPTPSRPSRPFASAPSCAGTLTGCRDCPTAMATLLAPETVRPRRHDRCRGAARSLRETPGRSPSGGPSRQMSWSH
jgi:hypothetical protein